MTAKEILSEMKDFIERTPGLSTEFNKYLNSIGFSDEQIAEINEGLENIDNLED